MGPEEVPGLGRVWVIPLGVWDVEVCNLGRVSFLGGHTARPTVPGLWAVCDSGVCWHPKCHQGITICDCLLAQVLARALRLGWEHRLLPAAVGPVHRASHKS